VCFWVSAVSRESLGLRVPGSPVVGFVVLDAFPQRFRGFSGFVHSTEAASAGSQKRAGGSQLVRRVLRLACTIHRPVPMSCSRKSLYGWMITVSQLPLCFFLGHEDMLPAVMAVPGWRW